MPESVSSDIETLTRLKKASRDVVDYLTTLGKLDLASLSKEAEESRVKILQELIEILSGSPDGLLNGGEANGEPVPEVVAEDLAEDYEVPASTLQRNAKPIEPDRASTASAEKKPESKSSIVHSKSNTDMKKKKGLTRMKSSQVVELPSKDNRKKEGNLIEKKLMRRTVQHWAILGADTLYLAKSSEETQSELKIRLKDASVSEQKNLREFLIKRQGKSYVLRADSDEECHLWIDHIQQCIDNVNGQECEFSDEEEDVPPVSPAVDTTDDKASVEPDEIYENEDETPKVGEDNEVDGDNDDVYDDVEAPTVAVPATLLSEPDRSESVSSATSSTSTAKRISIFGGSGKSKDGMPSEGILSGYVQKKGKFSWDKKWFVLSDQTLYYANGVTDKKCQGMLSLAGASIDTKSSDSRPYAINIKYKNNKMQLAWDDSQVYDDWVKAIKSAAGDDQSSDPSPSEKDLKVEENGEGEDEEAEEPQEDYVNPDLNPDAEDDGDDVYDDVETEPQKSDDNPAPVPQKQPSIKKQIRGGGKSELKDPDHSGYLHRKTTGIIKKWERKWFFIVDKTLYMSATEEEESYKNLLALANVSEVVKGHLEKQYPYGVTLQLKPSCGKDIILAAETKEDQSLWVAKLNEACDVFTCELSSDEEDGTYLTKALPPAPEPQVPQVEETVRVDDQGFIMEDIYEDVSQPLEAAPEPPPPKEPTKTDPSAPSLPPRNPNLKPTVSVPSAPSLPPRNQQPVAPTKPSPTPEPEPIMEEFYEDMDEVQKQYENAKSIAEQKNATAVEEPPVPKKDLPVPKADAEKKSPLLKKKELKKEKEQQKKEAKKKEKENKKLKKEKEKSKTIGSKAKGKSADLKPEDATARSQSFGAASTSQPPEDEEEYVIEELTAEDEKPKVDEPEPIGEEIYEDVEEPPPLSPQTTTPSTSLKKSPSPATVASMSTKSPPPRAGVLSPPGKVSEFKKSSSPISEPPRSQPVSPGGVKIRTGGITVSSISKPKPPTSVTPNGTAASTTSTTASTETTSTTSSSTTSTSLKSTVSKPVTSSALNRPRVKVSEAIYKFQKRSSTIDAVLHSGKLFHKAPGRTRFRQEYCEVSGTVMSFYREKGDERACGTLNLDECELRIVKEQYEGRRYVFCLAAGSASDMLSPELQADLDKWLSALEPLVKKYVKEE